jgi:cytochrome c peroxidase
MQQKLTTIAIFGFGFITMGVFLISNAFASSVAPVRVNVPHLPAQPYNYETIALPQHYQSNQVTQTDNTPAHNPISNEGATLGRVLFYDTQLSGNNTTSCASCHIQENGFSDPAQFSTGFEGGLTGRNSMGLANARYYERGHFFWDERADTLEDQVLMPIQDGVEMGMTLPELEAKLSNVDYYAPLFTDAFGSPEITSDRISLALAQFVRSMVSYESKYDEGVATNFANFTNQENQGRQLFFSNRTRCSNCHETDSFSLDRPRNIGLDLVFTDEGVGAITGNPNDVGEFKVPSLRNVAVTGPYMHDGRFDSLAEVVAFYNNGIQNHPNLSPILERNNGQPRRMNLNRQEQAALVAFLETLTDPSFLSDPKFSDPFVATNLTFRTFLPNLTR